MKLEFFNLPYMEFYSKTSVLLNTETHNNMGLKLVQHFSIHPSIHPSIQVVVMHLHARYHSKHWETTVKTRGHSPYLMELWFKLWATCENTRSKQITKI